MNDKLQKALAIVEKYGMKGDVIYKEIEALAASKPEPQAQAGEPEVVAWANSSALASASISRQRGGPFDQHTLGESKNSYHDTPLITLQAHREAIAKKDAALDACVEALESASGNINPERGFADEVEVEIKAAITQAEEAMK